MRQLVNEYRSKIQYALIGPYLGLMILVMLVGSFIAITLVADSWQERFNNQLGQVARNFTESFAQREIGNIEYLGQLSFTGPNAQTGVPAIAEAMRNRDTRGLELGLKGLWQRGQTSENVKLDRLIVFDPTGLALVDWERTPGNLAEPTRFLGTNLAGIPLIDTVLRGESQAVAGTDTLGDKYSGLLAFRSPDGADIVHFYTVAPVYLNDATTGNEILVGGLLVAQRLDALLPDLQNRSQAAVSTIYDVSGVTRASTGTGIELGELDMSPELIARVAALNTPDVPALGNERAGNSADPCIDIGNLTGRLASPVEPIRLPTCSVNTTVDLSGRQFQMVYAPLLIRGVQSGYFSVGLSTDFVTSAWAASRSAVLGITAVLAIMTVLVGLNVAGRITRPLNTLVQTAEAVTAGDLRRRSDLHDHSELGRLSSAFNQMTEHLLRLYTASRELNRTIEAEKVLAVATETSDSFVRGTEVFALLDHGDGFHYTTRLGASLPSGLEARRLSLETPLLARLAGHDPQESRLFPVPPEDLESADLGGMFQSALAAPIFRRDQLAGSLVFLHPEAEAFSEVDAQSLAVVANMAAAVLANALLYSQVRRDAKERRAILTSIGDGVVVCDAEGRMALLNHAAEQILGQPEWRSQRLYFDDLPLEPITQRFELFGHGNEQIQIGERFIRLTRSPVVGDDGLASGEVIVLHDVTEAAAIDKAKTEFIATISHELRTPLTVIRGFTELLLRNSGPDRLSPDQADLLSQVRARAVDMTDMVNNAILIADIEAGRLTTDRQPVELIATLQSALTPLQGGFAAKGLTVTLDLPPHLPPVLADREQLKRALSQLLDNARRYTDQGGVTVRARCEDDVVELAVIDTGPGIAPEVLPRLFRRFQRVEGNNSAERGGGLGLAIARQLIELQGGSIRASSTLGQGSVFTIILQQVNEHSIAVAQSSTATTAS